jgi:Phage integrase central domain
LLRAGDTGEHVAPDKITLSQWVDRCLALVEREPDGESPRRRGLVKTRTAERYAQLLKLHLVPSLGNRPLQHIQATEIDALYLKLERHLSPRTVHHVHTVLGGCLRAAVRKGMLSNNPIERAEAPVAGESDRGSVLDEETLLRASLKLSAARHYSRSSFPIVALTAFTGLRRNEISGCAGLTST